MRVNIGWPILGTFVLSAIFLVLLAVITYDNQATKMELKICREHDQEQHALLDRYRKSIDHFRPVCAHCWHTRNREAVVISSYGSHQEAILTMELQCCWCGDMREFAIKYYQGKVQWMPNVTVHPPLFVPDKGAIGIMTAVETKDGEMVTMHGLLLDSSYLFE